MRQIILKADFCQVFMMGVAITKRKQLMESIKENTKVQTAADGKFDPSIELHHGEMIRQISIPKKEMRKSIMIFLP